MAVPANRPEQTQRIMDASLNRIGEGLRLLEDISRFVLDDASLTKGLKELRHRLALSETPDRKSLIGARRVAADIGADIEASEQRTSQDIPALVTANSRRVQEALRTLEELAKLPESGMDTSLYRKARFHVYSLEKEITFRLKRRDKAERINGLYGIVDTSLLGSLSHKEAAEAFIKGGTGVIQLRDKKTSHRKLFAIAVGLKEACHSGNALFIVNDYLDIALAADADGLHIGQQDLPAAEVRQLLPVDKLLGVSVTNAAEAKEAEEAGADYIAAGAIYDTASKDIKTIGLEELKKIRMASRLPLIAIGGIGSENCAAVIEAGADAVAVISAVLSATEPQKAASKLSGAVSAYRRAGKARANLN